MDQAASVSASTKSPEVQDRGHLQFVMSYYMCIYHFKYGDEHVVVEKIVRKVRTHEYSYL